MYKLNNLKSKSKSKIIKHLINTPLYLKLLTKCVNNTTTTKQYLSEI